MNDGDMTRFTTARIFLFHETRPFLCLWQGIAMVTVIRMSPLR